MSGMEGEGCGGVCVKVKGLHVYRGLLLTITVP